MQTPMEIDFQGMAGTGCTGRTALHLLDPLNHGINRQLRLLLNRLYHLADLSCSLGGPLSQCPHLVGNHGKTAPLLAGPGRFNGRIKSQKVGLLCDRLDNGHDVVDLLVADDFELRFANNIGVPVSVRLACTMA